MQEDILETFRSVLLQYYEQFEQQPPRKQIFTIAEGGLFCQNTYLCDTKDIALDSIELAASDVIRFCTSEYSYDIIFNWLYHEPEPFVESITRQRHIELIYYDNRVERRRRM